MTSVSTLYDAYVKLRGAGVDARAALDQLRDDILNLPQDERHQLARQINTYLTEQGEMQPTPVRVASHKPVIKHLKPKTLDCPYCGKQNPVEEVLCYSCGKLLKPEQDRGSTRALMDANELFFDTEYFGVDSVLALAVRGAVDADNADTYQMRPQDSDHELLIGRMGPDRMMLPDVDLSPHQAEKRGVSRMHLSIRYDAQHHNLTTTDMNSANGTYINGQRLHPNEVRILRNGDELRLGRLVLLVTFYHVNGFSESDFN